MTLNYEASPDEVKQMTTAQLRNRFLIEGLCKLGAINTVYTMYDRMVFGCALPKNESLILPVYDGLKSDFFLERREMGIINVGGTGTVIVDSQTYYMEKLSCLYIGKGSKEVVFVGNDKENPPIFYFISTPAHHTFATTHYTKDDALSVDLGDVEKVNQRTIYKYIHKDGIQSCQLVMGLTVLKSGNVWNTMPAHTHLRRSEVYFYFDLAEDTNIIHLMGEPHETRHLVVRNHQAIISPPWSIHSGAGTASYSFIWAMGGENQDFSDMDFVPMNELM